MSILQFRSPIEFAKRLQDEVPLRRCELLECRAACCDLGVWLDLREMEDLLAHAAQLSPFMERERRDPECWFGATSEEDPDLPSGRVVPTAVTPKAGRLAGSECVFLRQDYRCALQLAGQALGEPDWRFKPFYCLAHPLMFESPGRLTLAPTDQLLAEPASCLRGTARAVSIETLLADELAAIRQLGRPS